ncbi:hypothetical protein, partial [Nocardioides sp. NPDC006273]|uniref:hypothetical protein n=1 Tax=Nocardioides sp. NPDC006273 TaxID=3155598 RepID=UPI0033AD5F0B
MLSCFDVFISTHRCDQGKPTEERESEPPPAEPGGCRRGAPSVARLGRVNTVLAALVVILVVLAAAVFIGGAR